MGRGVPATLIGHQCISTTTGGGCDGLQPNADSMWTTSPNATNHRRTRRCHNRLRGDGEESPFAGHALELVRAAVLELQPRPDHQVACWTRARRSDRPGRTRHRNTNRHQWLAAKSEHPARRTLSGWRRQPKPTSSPRWTTVGSGSSRWSGGSIRIAPRDRYLGSPGRPWRLRRTL